MAFYPIFVAGVVVLCTTMVALVRVFRNLFRRPSITEVNVLDRKHKSKCGVGKDRTYKVAIIGAGELFL